MASMNSQAGRDAECQPHVLCERCQQCTQKSKLLTQTPTTENVGMEETFTHYENINMLEDSARREGCHLCSLMLDTLNKSAPAAHQGGPLCVSFQYGEEIKSVIASGRDLRIAETLHCWPQCEMTIAHLGHGGTPVPLASLAILRTEYKPLLDQFSSKYSYVSEFWDLLAINKPHRAQLSLNTASDSCIQLAKMWIDNCCKEHLPCIPYSGYPLPTRLLDVGDSTTRGKLRLVLGRDQSESSRYVTLSYCWGRGKPLVLTEADLASFMADIDETRLPRTIADAVDITRRLGYRFLWVDSLCIIQDSPEDWASEAGKMGDVYYHSTLTIAATASETNEGGCYKARRPLSYLPCRLAGKPRNGKYVSNNRMSRQIYSISREFVQNAPLNQRAWVLQERLLSQRILHFSANGLIWECRVLQASDSRPEGHQLSQTASSEENLRWHLGNLLNSPTRRGKPKGLANSWRALGYRLATSPQKLDRLCYSHTWEIGFTDGWYTIVKVFSRCQLTVKTDKQPALAGIVSRVRNETGLRYIHGFWYRERLLAYQLLWTVKSAAENLLPRPVFRGAPTWSWMSVDGEVVYKGRTKLLSDPPIPFDFRLCTDIVSLRAASDDTATTGDELIRTDNYSVLGIKGKLVEISHADLVTLNFQPDYKVNESLVSSTTLYALPVAWDTSIYCKTVMSGSEQEKEHWRYYLRGFTGLILLPRGGNDDFERVGLFAIAPPQGPKVTNEQEARIAGFGMPGRLKNLHERTIYIH